jgi:hypothetical protein
MGSNCGLHNWRFGAIYKQGPGANNASQNNFLFIADTFDINGGYPEGPINTDMMSEALGESGNTSVEAPPQYGDRSVPSTEATGQQAPPPTYALQSHFVIGGHVTPSPLVSAGQLKAHLMLLRAFKDLRTKIEEGGDDFAKDSAGLVPEKRWIWFLELAVERCVFFSHLLVW